MTNRAQTTRAILLAKATVTSIFGLRASICASQDPTDAPRRQACRITALAPRISKRRMVRSPRFELAPSFCFPPVDFWSGVNLGRGEIASGSETPGRRHKCRDCGGSNRTHPRDRHQPPCDRVCPRASVDLTIQFLDLHFQREKVSISSLRIARALSGKEQFGSST